MRHLPTYRFLSIPIFFQVVMLSCLFLVVSCEKDEATVDDPAQEGVMDNQDDENSNDDSSDGNMDEEADSGNQSNDCPSSIGFVFEEANGIVSACNRSRAGCSIAVVRMS
ncbi:MAG: hypothetical protein AAF039_18105, partial [Bacteroidota bacterium]